MFLFSPKFDWSFSRLPRFNWGYWTLRKCSYFTQMFLILPKTLLKFLWFAQISWRLLELPHDSNSLKGSVYFAIRGKKEWQKVWEYFAVLAIIQLLTWLLFCLSLEKIDTISLTCECSCILCPNFENFCPNNGQFFSTGDATCGIPICLFGRFHESTG